MDDAYEEDESHKFLNIIMDDSPMRHRTVAILRRGAFLRDGRPTRPLGKEGPAGRADSG